MPDQINRYLISMLETEIEFVRARTEKVDRAVNRINSFYVLRFKEVFWTARRILRDSSLFQKWKAAGRGKDYLSSRSEKAAADEMRDAMAYSSRPNSDATRKAGRRVLIDTTPVHRDGGQTGIQRVVRQIARAAAQSGDGLPVFISKGRLYRYLGGPELAERIEIAEGDIFIMPDASWNHYDEYPPIMEQVSRANGSNIVVVYDLIPMRYPAAFRGVPELFDAWLKLALTADGVVAISRSTAEDFLAYARANMAAANPNMRVGWWRLGADFQADGAQPPSGEANIVGAGDTPFFLSVGTLEPRKGYPIALSAFERLWEAGVDVRYVIVGGRGWNSRALEERIVQSVEFGRRLFWLEKATDADIRHLYTRARGLVAASFAEGFGLPIIEAAHYGLPAIVSDIPVFREIGNEATRYFAVLDGDSLAACIQDALARAKPAVVHASPSWKEATATLLEMVWNDGYQLRVDGSANA